MNVNVKIERDLDERFISYDNFNYLFDFLPGVYFDVKDRFGFSKLLKIYSKKR